MSQESILAVLPFEDEGPAMSMTQIREASGVRGGQGASMKSLRRWGEIIVTYESGIPKYLKARNPVMNKSELKRMPRMGRPAGSKSKSDGRLSRNWVSIRFGKACDDLLVIIQANPGKNMTTLAEIVGCSRNTIHERVKRLLAEDRVYVEMGGPHGETRSFAKTNPTKCEVMEG